MNGLTDALARSTVATGERILAYLPDLLGGLALVLVGWVVARLLRSATWRAVGWIDALIARGTHQQRWRIADSASILAAIVYWVVLLFFVTAAAQTVGLQIFTDWLARLLEHLPALAAGLLIMVAGYALSGFVAELILAAAKGLEVTQRKALARAAQGATLMVALLVGADQIGLKVTWLAIFAAVLVASLLGGLAVAVSLGARSYVGNLIGAHHLRQAFRAGQRVRVAGHEGLIIDFTVTSLVLETADGRVLLPGRIYNEEAIVLISGTGQRDGAG